MGSQNKPLPRNLLVARFSAIGDVALSIPVIYSACRRNPSVRFVYVTRPSMTQIFVNPPENLVVVGVDLKEEYKGPGGMRRLMNRLIAEYDIDAFADLHGVIRTHLMHLWGALKGVRCRSIKKGRGSKRALTRRNNKVMLPLISSRARYREVLYGFGLDINPDFKGLFPAGGADPALFAEITAPKADGEKWIGIAPFAQHRGKIYPPQQMEKVVEALSAKPGVKIFLFGGGDSEREVLASWAGRYPGVVNVAERRYGFSTELALQSHLDLMVSMDSANMHLASIAGARVVSVWGATHPYCGFKGFHQKEADIIQLPMPCRPCSVFGNKPCMRGDYHCLSGISPKVIVGRVCDIIGC